MVETLKVAEEVPEGIFTELGIVRFALFELKLTDMPPVGASPFRLTVPIVVEPPAISTGDSVKFANVAV